MTDCRVLVTSDTHVHDAARLPAALLALAEQADQIVHAGDLSVPDVVDVLQQFAPVTAVHGNVDDADVLARLQTRTEVELCGVRFGIVHDAGPRSDRHQRLRAAFPSCAVCVYGHSHQPETTQLDDGCWIINPGSPSQRRRAPFHSAVWVTLAGGGISSVDLIDLDSGGVGG